MLLPGGVIGIAIGHAGETYLGDVVLLERSSGYAFVNAKRDSLVPTWPPVSDRRAGVGAVDAGVDLAPETRDRLALWPLAGFLPLSAREARGPAPRARDAFATLPPCAWAVATRATLCAIASLAGTDRSVAQAVRRRGLHWPEADPRASLSTLTVRPRDRDVLADSPLTITGCRARIPIDRRRCGR